MSHLSALLADSWSDAAVVASLIGAGIALVVGVMQVAAALLGIPEFRRRFLSAAAVEVTPTEAAPQGAAWSVSETDIGQLYKSKAAGDKDVLLVFVHGILGSADGTWGRLPELLCRRLAPRFPDFDILSFGYPAGLIHSASIEHAAKGLGGALVNPPYRTYRHLLFVTHSTGGLVVKCVLLADMQESLRRLNEPSLEDVRNVSSVAFRTRQVINIAVPHTGGSLRASLLLVPLYHLLLPVWLSCWGVLWCTSRLPVIGKWTKPPRGYSYGYNQIVWQLWYRNGRLRRLEERYRAEVLQFDRRRLPRPVSIEINGSHDTTIHQFRQHATNDITNYSVQQPRETSQEDTARLVLRGTHPTVKAASSPHDGIVAYIADFLERRRPSAETVLATETLTRSLDLDRGSELVGAAELVQPMPEEWTEEADAPGTE